MCWRGRLDFLAFIIGGSDDFCFVICPNLVRIGAPGGPGDLEGKMILLDGTGGLHSSNGISYQDVRCSEIH